MTEKQLQDHLENLKERATEFGIRRDRAAALGVDSLQAKEVGMLERNDEDEEDED